MKKSHCFCVLTIGMMFGSHINAFSQVEQESVERGQRYVINIPYTVFGLTGVAGAATTTFNLCAKAKIKVVNTLSTSSQVIVTVIRAKNCAASGSISPVTVGTSYVISNTAWAYMRRPTLGYAVGPLVVPAKVERSTSKIFTGGQIGVYAGPKINFGYSGYFSVVGSAGFGNIAVNNTLTANSQDTRTVPGYYFAGGIMINAIKKLNLGIIWGVDKFNVDDQKVARRWTSISITTPIVTDK